MEALSIGDLLNHFYSCYLLKYWFELADGGLSFMTVATRLDKEIYSVIGIAGTYKWHL